MPLKTLIVIALRLYAIYWLVEGLSQLLIFGPAVVAVNLQMSKTHAWQSSQASALQSPFSLYSFLLMPLATLILATILWFIASRISTAVTKGHDTDLAFTVLTRDDLYHFAFVFLGLYFVLTSISGALREGFRFFPIVESNPQTVELLGPFLGHGATFVAGFVCMIGAGRWTRKLMRREKKQESLSSPPQAI